MRRRSMFIALASTMLAASVPAAAQSRGIDGRRAPSWQVDTWFNLPDDTTTLDIDDYAGKVLYLYGFQSWCPGCHSRGFPTLKELITHYDGNDEVAFVAVQTVFEGYDTNTAARARATGKRYDLDIPIGHSGARGAPSKLMRAYRTGGTPWTIIIDRDGVVRYDDFHVAPERGVKIIDGLLGRPEQPTPSAATPASPGVHRVPAIETLPDERGGQDLVGTKFPPLKVDRWARRTHTSKRMPRATLYRWWTDTCHWCEASMPAVETLRKRYEADGLRTVAVYHPKPPRNEPDESIIAMANDFGYGGDLAVDPDWSALHRAYLDSGQRAATSVSILVDDAGIVRFVHPGPVFHPSDDPEHAQRNADYLALDAAIKVLVAPRADVAPPASLSSPPRPK